MAVVKVIEIIASSKESWEDATQKALKEASKKIRNVNSIYIQQMKAIVENNEITEYRVDAKVSFLLEENR